ncbi:hypothetical protein llap_2068 [Limosa lapponica baueri]|uniref:Uncharacterized protein n=1 Tax=Limosa lapponica baueri TaxID=1758121 RepID=A0A2I0UNJ2_LIMLA|nr:hypothetical protein llap_2068 [Limosa lapponica baueri]
MKTHGQLETPWQRKTTGVQPSASSHRSDGALLVRVRFRVAFLLLVLVEHLEAVLQSYTEAFAEQHREFKETMNQILLLDVCMASTGFYENCGPPSQRPGSYIQWSTDMAFEDTSCLGIVSALLLEERQKIVLEESHKFKPDLNGIPEYPKDASEKPLST